MAQSGKYVITKGSNSGFSVYEIIEFEREYDNTVYTYHTYKYAGRSKSLDNLMRKYPEATLELDRCRRGSYTVRVSRRYIDITLMPYGKYRGTRYTEVEDHAYLNYFYKNCCDNLPVFKKLLKNYLIAKCGYVVDKDGELVEKAQQTKSIMAMLPFISNNTFEFTADSNLKYDEELDGSQAGYLYYKDTVNDTNVKIYFPETQKYAYQGFLYGYPIDAKGKPRRIKGKKIKLTEFTHEAVERNRKIIVHVKSWEFVK